jgi:hypothetical protein
MADAPQSVPNFSNPILGRFFLSKEEKADKEKGKLIVKAIYNQQTNNDSSLNFFKGRNARWIMLLLWSKGSQNIKEFLDYINVSDANKAWVNIDMTQSRIAPQFVQTLVESMAKNRTYPCVNAIDDGSLTEKEDRMYEALFRMREVETINDVQQQAGVQIEQSNVYVPDDEISAKVYFELEDRLPKEIRFEKMLFKVQDDIHFERILNRKTIFDLTVLNAGITKIEKLAPKQYTVRRCIPTNMVYNFFMNDNGEQEITQIGEFYSLKVKDFRSKFGKSPERPNGLDEKQIFELAKLSSNKSIGTYSNVGMFNYIWNDTWANSSYSYSRPYDDSSILVFDCEVNFEEEQYYVSKLDAYGKADIQAKKGVPYQQTTKDGKIIEQPKPEGTEIIKQQKNTWMRGVYAPYGDVMLYWGQPDLIITPYTDVAKPMSAYSINIPNNDGEYVPSLFERIIEPLREYQLVKLKRKQIIALVEPDGFRIDIESARNIDLGTGDAIAWEEIVRIKNQTGVELWSSKGIDPLAPQTPPISQGTQSTNIQKIVSLTEVLASIVSEIRQLIGVPQYRDGSDVGDRTSGVLQEQQNVSSFNVTNFVANANNQLWEETFNKLNLLHWNDIVKEEPESKDDLINTRFQTTVKMKSTDYEIQQLERDIDRYSQMPDAQGNPSLTLKDAMFLREIDDAKLARWYLTKMYEENRRNAIKESERLQSQNAQVQQQSAQQAAEQAAKLQQDQIAAEEKLEEFKSTRKKEEILLQGLLAAAAKDESGKLIQAFMPALQQLVPNITIPLAQENQQMQQAIAAQQQQQMMQAQQSQGQQMQEPPEQEMQEQPQESQQQEMAEMPQ